MRSIRRASLFGLIAVVLATAGVVGACSSNPNEANTLGVLAGSELRDLEPLLPELEKATGVRLTMTYVGTLEGAERIIDGDPADAAWFSHGKYLALLPETGSRIVASRETMLSPVVIGVKKSVADGFGWTDNPDVTWKDIQAKAADGSFHFAMTNPASSNSGFTALIGVASALSGSSDAIDTGQIDEEALSAFFRGQTLTAGSSGFLAEAYEREQDQLDGIVNYESVLLSMNASGRLRDELTLIYPKEGIVTADYPFMLLNADKREAYDKAVAWLLQAETQGEIMATTLRRPAIPGVPLDPRIPRATLIELPFPSRLATVDALITTYLDVERRPAAAIFVLDVSGSMEGDRLESLKTAMNALTGTDPSLTGRFSRFRAREQVTIITFSSDVVDEREFTIDDTEPDGPDMTAIRDFTNSLQTVEGTAIYSALQRAYELVSEKQQTQPDLLYSIVLMTDGENNEGIGPEAFDDVYASLPDTARATRVFPVRFGDAGEDALQAIADLTGGRLFDAQQTSLSTIFKQIRGYQ